MINDIKISVNLQQISWAFNLKKSKTHKNLLSKVLFVCHWNKMIQEIYELIVTAVAFQISYSCWVFFRAFSCRNFLERYFNSPCSKISTPVMTSTLLLMRYLSSENDLLGLINILNKCLQTSKITIGMIFKLSVSPYIRKSLHFHILFCFEDIVDCHTNVLVRESFAFQITIDAIDTYWP